MKALKALDAEYYLLKAADLVQKQGLAKGVTSCPDNGPLSAAGAIYVACGASQRKMQRSAFSAEEAGVPESFCAIADEIVLFVESIINCEDIHEWNDMHGNKNAVAEIFRKSAMRLIILGQN